MAWKKDDLRKIAEADDLHNRALPRGWREVRHADLDLVCRCRRCAYAGYRPAFASGFVA